MRSADWLLDNAYQVTRAIRTLDEDFPPAFYRRLSALSDPVAERTPRVVDLAQDLMDRLQHQVSMHALVEYLVAYQDVSALSNAELWALPSVLRLVALDRLVAAFSLLEPSLAPRFEPTPWSKQAAMRDPPTAVSDALTTLIGIQAIKWTDVVERTSRIEAALCDDPADVYRLMTLETRSRYRSVVETLAEQARCSELSVADQALALARRIPTDPLRSHVGYWLIDDGRPELEAALGCRLPLAMAVRRFLSARRHAFYWGALALGWLVGLLVPSWHLLMTDANIWHWIGVLLLSALPATVLSVTVIHWLITRFTRPSGLPELDFSKKIPARFTTAVVVPVIVSREEEIAHIAEKMEIRWLSNRDAALRFILLTDLPDAPEQNQPGDARIERCLQATVRAMNARYDTGAGGPFVLLHRGRSFNPSEGCWMGWERKRGKLESFNKLVTGGLAAPEVFSHVEGDVARLQEIVFAIVLDADTELPPGSAAHLVGTLAHPLNRVQFDPVSGRVARGYTILQPRLEVMPDDKPVTHFSYLYTGDTAIDIYSRAVSDVYQDVFGVGIFAGKGIYDVAAFLSTVADRVPENSILSHDLFEGLHGRVALASNIVLYEDFPTTYLDYAARAHRWMRGDWQLLPWLWRRVPAAHGTQVATVFSNLDRWKIVDNLRRSLVPPALLLFFIAGWMVLPGSAVLWTILALAAPGSYIFAEVYGVLSGGFRRGALGYALHRFTEKGGRWFLAITFLVTDTMIGIDAVFRTLWRLYVKPQYLLEWTSAAHSAAKLRDQPIRSTLWKMMWPSSALALTIAAQLMLYDLQSFWPAAPVLLLWLIAPEIAVWTARPRLLRREHLGADQVQFLRGVALRTWHYFETFTGPEDNWLPPDNFQQHETGQVAHRTSPTNIGMFLASALSARDMGFVTTSDLMVRCRNTVETLERLETYRGHVFNWYDTRSLAPLEPKYVSMVDSGNLAVSLIALKQGCLEAAKAPAFDSACWDALRTTTQLLTQALRRIRGTQQSALEGCVRQIEAKIADADNDPTCWKEVADALAGPLWHQIETAVHEAIAAAPAIATELLSEIQVWLDAFHRQVHALARDVGSFFPWAALLADPPGPLEKLAQDVARRLAPLRPIPDLIEDAPRVLDELGAALRAAAQDPASRAWLDDLTRAIEEGVSRQKDLARDLDILAQRCGALAYSMDFAFLYDEEARLFVIGYNHSVGRMDHNHYDLLATEARLASYFAIAKHDAPVEHWFALGRPITRIRGKPSILSWSGSMFEYLMPALFLPSRRDTLLGESEATAVYYQRRYATERGIPWGISESAYGLTDAGGDYQYRAFGVPGLGIKRGLSDDLVVAPYASALALCALPRAAVLNLKALEKLEALGTFGFYDALDFTPSRRFGPHRFVAVRTYMAHHQGMTLVAIANVLMGDIHVRRVMREETFQAMDLLLHERVPWDAPIETGQIREAQDAYADADVLAPAALPAWVPSTAAAVPQLHMLGNAHLSARVSEAGGGGLFWQGDALTRWRPDATRDCHGTWVYVREGAQRSVWSIGRQPTQARGPEGKTVFHQHMVETFRRHDDISTRMEVAIAPYDDVEIRKITVINESNVAREVDIVSYAEVVLAAPQQDERHPAFSKLFVGSTYLPDQGALLFERRPRRPETRPPVLLHRLVTTGPDLTVHGFETDRARFIGRNGSAKDPQGLREGLSGTTGWTLDPVMALQVRLRLKPMETRSFAFLTVVGPSRGDVLDTAARYPFQALDRAFRDAALEAAREVQRLQLDPAKLPQLQAMSSLLLQPSATLRAVPASVSGVRLGQPGLWRLGISGDLPILLVSVNQTQDLTLLETLVRAQKLWRHRGLQFDLVILHMGASGYEGPLREYILSVLRDTHSESSLGRNGGLRLLSADQTDPETLACLTAAAHVVLERDAEDLSELLDRMLETRFPAPPFQPLGSIGFETRQPLARPASLQFDNGLGGFDPQTQDYVIHLAPGTHTPAPWCNVLTNEDFGTIVSESGLGMTWALNSGENRLTPWSNDPVADEPGEVLYLRDEATAEVWTPTPAPLGHAAECQIRHGKGYTRWTQFSHEIEQDLIALVPTDAPVKLIRLRLKNRSALTRRVTATYYAEWVLGAMESAAKPHVVTIYDAELKAILARNGWTPEFGARIAFLSASQEPHSLTGDRHDFLGKEGSVSDPAGLKRWDLGGRFVPGADACGGYQVHLNLEPNETTEVVFVLGQGSDLAAAGALLATWRSPEAFAQAFDQVASSWEARLGAVQVTTPDPAFDLMVNRWLPYQNTACRLMARAGFYQAGGAYGFRDQLQDVLAVLFSDPARARSQILRAAACQFETGDALHWWHPPSGRGVRTRCSDDYLWLAYVTARYVAATGDTAILDVEIPFLTGAELDPDEGDRYARFETGASASVFEHCARALDRMIAVGAHGLPLIGTGDWNDGMDRVGDAGRGESVWLAWFEIATTGLFAPLAEPYAEHARAERWRHHAQALRGAIHDEAWDGAWFLRAFDDEGAPWGSDSNDECRIDLIAQAWSILSGDPPDARAYQAMESARAQLVDPKARLIRLLTPPFHLTGRDPGYIQAYPAGIRENGGQYTHAAAWLGLAFAQMGAGDDAWQVFDIINPIRRTSSPEAAAVYLREPYVLPGDVSGKAHAGQGGWSWYTGAAGWTWQLAIHGIFGVTVLSGAIRVAPCLPRDWGQAKILLRGPQGTLALSIEDPDHLGTGRAEITVDGVSTKGDTVRFPGAGQTRTVRVRIFPRPQSATPPDPPVPHTEA